MQMPIWGYPPKVWTKCDFYENRVFLKNSQKIVNKLYFWGPRGPQKNQVYVQNGFFYFFRGPGAPRGAQGPQKSNFIEIFGGGAP